MRDKKRESYLTASQMTAIHLLATGHKWSDVAQVLGISQTLLGKWSRLPAFRAELSNARRYLVRS
jgi:hypothetical protein